jgi:hypothetical protein
VKRTDSYFTEDTFFDEDKTDGNEFKMDGNLFDQMDKEALEELDDEDDGEGTDYEGDENTQEETHSDGSSSFNSEFNEGDEFDIDDEMVLALEKNF